MRKFDDIGLGSKLAINFLVGGGVLIAAIAFCIFQIRMVGGATNAIATNWLPSIQQAGEISQLRLRYRVRSLEFMLATSDEERAKIVESLGGLDKSLNDALKKYEPLISSDAERKAYQDAVKAVGIYHAAVQEAIALVRSGKNEEAEKLRKTTWLKTADAVRDAVDELGKINRAGSEQAAAEARAAVTSAIVGGIAALGIGTVLAILVSGLIARQVGRRLSASVAAAQEIAAGNLNAELPAASRDEVGRLIAAMADMQRGLRQAMAETSASAQSILECSDRLNRAVREIDDSAHSQSSVASSIAANIEQLTVSITHVSDNTSEAARAAHASDEQASGGHAEIEKLVSRIGEVADVVRLAAEQISRLEGESAKISNIVNVIKDIADQTNLLALNAAIEAARAGEQGRGFAVVADEVRKLSERTAHSTGEIETMVGGIQQSTHEVVAEVGRGVNLVEESVANARQAGEAIARLRELAQRVSGAIGDVDESLREQTAASTDVAKKVEEVATQAEAATEVSRQTAAAAEAMAETARKLQQLVARFRI